MAYRIYMPLPQLPSVNLTSAMRKDISDLLPPDVNCAILDFKASLNTGIDEGVNVSDVFIGWFMSILSFCKQIDSF